MKYKYGLWKGVKRKSKLSFTLAEVLITLAIVGIISILVIPNIIEEYRWIQYRTAAKKVISTLDNAIGMYRAKKGVNPACGYWKKPPVPCDAVCDSYTSEDDFTKNDEENDIKNVTCLQSSCANTGQSIPSNYNGPMGDCGDLLDFMIENFNTVKVCERQAYIGGCIPDYKGRDDIHYENNKENYDSVYDAYQAAVWTPFKNQYTKTEETAFVTADGMIFIPYIKLPAFMAVDLNGFAPPNKWGYDLHIFQAKTINAYTRPVYEPYDFDVEKGGKSTKVLLK